MIRLHALAFALTPVLGCAVAAAPLPSAPDPATMWGAKAQRTAFEDPSQSTSPAPVGPAARESYAPDAEKSKEQRTRTGLFWGGLATAVVGGAMLTAFGIGGRVTQRQLKEGYDDADLTYDREDTLRDRGKVFNALAGAGAGIAIVGGAVAAIVYGIDYTRCGTLAKRRKDCRTK